MLWPQVSARQAYPLYYNLARPFVLATAPMDPARALNLFSALWAAAAVGLLVFVCATVSRSLAAGAIAGGLLAFSYTFWTQAVIAEVYTLHLALIALCCVLLCAYAARPTVARLTIFLAVYAIAFGNHFSMILLIVPFAVFLLQSAPAPASLFRPAVVLIALAAAVVGALQYVPNFLSVASAFDAPAAWSDSAAGILVRHDQAGLARHDGVRHRGQPGCRSVGHVVVRRPATVRYRRPRARGYRDRRLVADIASMGCARRCGARDQYGVRAHLQRRRLACVLPARALHDRIPGRRRRRMDCTRARHDGRRSRTRRPDRGALHRVAWMVHLARGRPPHRSPRRAVDRQAVLRHQRTGCPARVSDELAAGERPALHPAAPPS